MRGCRGVIRPGSMGARTPGSPTVGGDDPIGAVPVAVLPGAGLDQAWFGLLRRGAQVERRVADLGVPVAVWRRLVDVAAAQAGVQVLTYLVPADVLGAEGVNASRSTNSRRSITTSESSTSSRTSSRAR